MFILITPLYLIVIINNKHGGFNTFKPIFIFKITIKAKNVQCVVFLHHFHFFDIFRKINDFIV